MAKNDEAPELAGQKKPTEKAKDAPTEKDLARVADQQSDEQRQPQADDRRQDPSYGVVARGHKVQIEADGKFYGYGEIVGPLDPAEIKKLRARGVLVTPAMAFDEKAGPSVLIEDDVAKGSKEA